MCFNTLHIKCFHWCTKSFEFSAFFVFSSAVCFFVVAVIHYGHEGLKLVTQVMQKWVNFMPHYLEDITVTSAKEVKNCTNAVPMQWHGEIGDANTFCPQIGRHN